VQKVLQNGTIYVKLNGTIGPYFQSFKGVRQGDPLSPLLFNMAADYLARMAIKVQQNNLVTSLITDIIPNGVAILQYADDTIMCLEHDMEKARNLKLLLYILLLGGDDNIVVTYAEIFNYQIGGFPLKYI
jgi:hypothetical protein